LILLDVELPDGNGFSFLVELQSAEINNLPPIVMLTGRVGAADKVTGFSMGADDYITKPLDLMVFKAHIESKMRKKKSQNNVVKKDGFVFSLEKQTVVFESPTDPTPLDLTTLEFKLFFYLIQHKDHVLSREKLIADVWGDQHNVTDRTIDSHISHLRKHLSGSTLTIQSVYGAGYKLTLNKKAA
jgi:DNA-binding response OmpR family regulator